MFSVFQIHLIAIFHLKNYASMQSYKWKMLFCMKLSLIDSRHQVVLEINCIKSCMTDCQLHEWLASVCVWYSWSLGDTLLCRIHRYAWAPKGMIFNLFWSQIGYPLLAILALSRAWFLYYSLELGMLFRWS